jgi:hypothetical protein
VSTTPIESLTDTSLRARWKRRRRLIIAVVAALTVVGPFAAWGPDRYRPWPDREHVRRQCHHWLGLAYPSGDVRGFIYAGSSGAVIDSIAVVSDSSYPAPHVISIRGDGDQICGGAWALTGRQNFYASCTAGRLVPLIGRHVPVSS